MPETAENSFITALKNRVLVGDGAMGTMIQAVDLSLDDFLQLEGCNEILNVTRPEVLENIHRTYFLAGSDVVETNTFGCNLSNLGDYDIAHRCEELAFAGVDIARKVADELTAQDSKPRYVLGSLGPGTKLPTLGHTTFAEITTAYTEAATGMIKAGADGVLIETCQDILQAKSAVLGCQEAMKQLGTTIPIVVHITIETTGTMLLGTEVGAALNALVPLGIDMIGLNCATGPAEMSEHLRHLAKHSPIPISVMPNAGLPELGENGAVYPLGAHDMATALNSFLTEYKPRFVGGCCGTTPEHIAEIRAIVDKHNDAGSTYDPAHEAENGVCSLYSFTPFTADAGITMIGERTNANGSKAFREAMLAGDWQQCLDIAKAQTRDGAHLLDLCVDYVGRDGVQDMRELAGRLATASTLPIMLDSTEPAVLQAGLESLGGRCIINSVNYEDGDGPNSRFTKIMHLVKAHGAAVVGLAIDEEGQARTADHKVAIAERLIEDLTTNWSIPQEDIIIDLLTFPISTGQEEVRRDGIETIEAIRRLTENYPRIHTTLGLSNISFGLNPAARQVLNSVFLHECIQAGLDTAIAHSSKILPLSKISDEHTQVAMDLIYNRRRDDYDPLTTFMELFDGVSAASSKDERAAAFAAMDVFERLEARIVEGERDGLEADLDLARETKSPLEIINDTLLSGMKTVGELFGSGQMQLPFVLASAEVMKLSVALLEPHMDSVDTAGKGTIVLATVKGDVHDIGKNLVDIILSNNGYDVANIGIKQPVSAIVAAAQEHNADVVGMSGLLVKSTVIMKENLEELNSLQMARDLPVLLGGAALTRTYVEGDLTETYDGHVFYAKDAFEGLELMEKIMDAKKAGTDLSSILAADTKAIERKARRERSQKIAEKRKANAPHVEVPARSDVADTRDLATPPFWGTRVVKGIAVADYASLIDERALFFGQWGLKGSRKGEGPGYDELVDTEGKPRLRYWLDRLKTEGILDSAAVVYGYFPVVSEGDNVHVLAEPTADAEILHTINFPRQQRGRFLSIPDFVCSRQRAAEIGRVDVLPLQMVTMGQPIADFANVLFEQDSYRDYLEVHGLSVQLTEALAEYWHQRVRSELTIADTSVASEDSDNTQDFFDLKYRGARYSFGYGACPNLEDRALMVELLQSERIGVELSEEFQLHPEQSTDAFVLYHPEAKYFNI